MRPTFLTTSCAIIAIALCSCGNESDSGDSSISLLATVGDIEIHIDDLLADSSIEVLDIAVPPQHQPDLILEACKKGTVKGILAQKPLALDYATARSLVEACEAVLDGSAQAFIGLGGNFVRAIPDHARMEPKWRGLDLTVHIATKLNRSHLLPGETSYLLPCLGRIETDMQGTGPQSVSIEDSFSQIYGSKGKATPAAETLLSEPAIVAGIAKATLARNPKLDWDAWVRDYARVRDAIEVTYPELFKDFNDQMFTPGGFWKGVPAAHREWKTESGKAEINIPQSLNVTGFEEVEGRFRLMTLRSNDQFNTTVYGYHDRFRGVKGTRDIVFMNRSDMIRMGIADGEDVDLVGDAGGNADRRLNKLRVVEYSIPEGCLGAYYPECNLLMPVAHHARESHVPAAKSVPVRIEKTR